MPGVLKRVVFVDKSKGYCIEHDWAQVTTALGTCAEPFWTRKSFGFSSGIPAFNPNDDISVISDVQEMPIGRELSMWSCSTGTVLHGGRMYPRSGY